MSSSASTVPNRTCSRSTRAAFDRDDGDAERERQEVEGGEARVLAQHGRARDESRRERDREPGGETAEAHGKEREPGEQIADRGARQDRVAHGVAHQAHAPQHEEHADGRRGKRQREAADKRAPHEGELGEGAGQRLDHAGSRSRAGSPGLARISAASCTDVLSSCAFASLFAHANPGMIVERRDQFARFGEVILGQDFARLAPGHDLTREQQRLRENAPAPARDRAAPPTLSGLRGASP